MIIVAPDVSEDELPGVIDRVGGFITTAGGSLTATLRESPWGRRRLAYAIRHGGRDVRDGFYTVYHFDAPPSAITDIERELLLTDQVIRFLVTHFTPQPVIEQPAEVATEGEDQLSAETTSEVAKTAEALEAAEPEAVAAGVPREGETEAEAATDVDAVAEPDAHGELEPATEPEASADKESAAEPEVEEAPAKKRVTRRKKAEATEDVEATADSSDE